MGGKSNLRVYGVVKWEFPDNIKKEKKEATLFDGNKCVLMKTTGKLSQSNGL